MSTDHNIRGPCTYIWKDSWPSLAMKIPPMHVPLRRETLWRIPLRRSETRSLCVSVAPPRTPLMPSLSHSQQIRSTLKKRKRNRQSSDAPADKGISGFRQLLIAQECFLLKHLKVMTSWYFLVSMMNHQLQRWILFNYGKKISKRVQIMYLYLNVVFLPGPYIRTIINFAISDYNYRTQLVNIN